MDTSLEHFVHIEDVVRFIQQHLPPEQGEDTWRAVCTDVLHCELAKVEPILLKALQATRDPKQTETIRELIRAASWYTHPQLSQEALVNTLDTLVRHLPAHADLLSEQQIHTIRTALTQEHEGAKALPASQAIDQLIIALSNSPVLESLLIPAREVRDQLYYQLLYPHWFEIVKNWTEKQAPLS